MESGKYARLDFTRGDNSQFTVSGNVYVKAILGCDYDRAKKDIAKLIGTSVQNVRNVLSSAKESLVRKYIERYRDIITTHQNQPTK